MTIVIVNEVDGQSALTKPTRFATSVLTLPQIRRLAAHFAQNRSEILRNVQLSDLPNARRAMQPTRVPVRAN